MEEITVYFDALTDDDYDNIVRYLLKNQCPMAKRNKMDKSLAAKVPLGLPEKMLMEVEFEELVSYGDKPLDERFLVREEDTWSNPDPRFENIEIQKLKSPKPEPKEEKPEGTFPGSTGI